MRALHHCFLGVQLTFMQRSGWNGLAKMSGKFRVVEIVVIWSLIAPYFDDALNCDQLPYVGRVLIREEQVPCCEDEIVVIWSLASLNPLCVHILLIDRRVVLKVAKKCFERNFFYYNLFQIGSCVTKNTPMGVLLSTMIPMHAF